MLSRRSTIVAAAAAGASLLPALIRADAVSNEAIARRYIDEVWNQGNVDVLDELVAEDFQPSHPDVDAPGRDAFKTRTQEAIGQWRALIPDVRFTIESL